MYLYEFAVKNDTTMFITTHSNVVIDTFSGLEKAQIMHVKKEGDKSHVKAALSYKDSKHIINDLEIKASSILQSNGIIWVEDPSDRHYINKWLSLLSPDLKEGIHYAIMFYGGRLLSGLCFTVADVENELIPLLRINTNAYVVIDRDGTSVTELNKTKSRIKAEIGDGSYWITEGREIENYLSTNTVKKWIGPEHVWDGELTMDSEVKFQTILNNHGVKNVKYDINKSAASLAVRDYIEFSDLEVLDLKDKLVEIVTMIRKWNGLREN